MRVQVKYTIKVMGEDRANLACELGEWPTREVIKGYLQYVGVGGLEELGGRARMFTAAELREKGVPKHIAEYVGRAPGEGTSPAEARGPRLVP